MLAVAGPIPWLAAFLWGHRILVPLIGAAVWIGTLIGYGVCINSCFWRAFGKKTQICFRSGEKIVLGLTTGSLCMDGVCVCGFPYRTWRDRALEKVRNLAFVGIMGICLWKSRAIFQKIWGPNHSRREGHCLKQCLGGSLLSSLPCCFLLGRAFKSLSWGLRFPSTMVFVPFTYWTTEKVFSENMGMINLVYTTQQRGARSTGTVFGGQHPTYGFVLSFTVSWTTGINGALINCCSGSAGALGNKTAGFWTGALFIKHSRDFGIWRFPQKVTVYHAKCVSLLFMICFGLVLAWI